MNLFDRQRYKLLYDFMDHISHIHLDFNFPSQKTFPKPSSFPLFIIHLGRERSL